MRIPPFWAKETYSGTDRDGRTRAFPAWGWSFHDLAEAKADARARAQRIFEHFRADSTPDTYGYLDVPLREEIVDSLTLDGQEVAVVTRNRYGALVLNAANVCFVDVDFPRPRANGILDSLAMLFSPRKRAERTEATQRQVFDAVAVWAARNPERSFRLYRTCAGLRLLFTDRAYDPLGNETEALLDALGSDRLYRILTRKQECFRARLTPKPWRCGLRTPAIRFPRETKEAEQAHRDWLRRYEKAGTGYTTCWLIDSCGPGAITDHAAAVVHLHDTYACGAPDTPLA